MLCLLKVTFWFFRYSYQYHIIRKKEYLVEIITSHHSMSLVCRSLSLVLSRYSTDCHPLSVVVTCCHSLSIVVTLFTIVVTCFCSLSLDVSLVSCCNERCSVNKVLLKISQNSHWSLFFQKIASWKHDILLKKRL